MRGTWHLRAAWLALLALALQLALPLWHQPASAAAWLCTAHGLRSVAVDADGQPLPAAPQPAKPCPICQLAHAVGAGVLPEPPAVSEPVVFVAIATVPIPTDRPVTLAAPPPSTRAPPAV
jgi:hypothetical protein